MSWWRVVAARTGAVNARLRSPDRRKGGLLDGDGDLST